MVEWISLTTIIIQTPPMSRNPSVVMDLRSLILQSDLIKMQNLLSRNRSVEQEYHQQETALWEEYWFDAQFEVENIPTLETVDVWQEYAPCDLYFSLLFRCLGSLYIPLMISLGSHPYLLPLILSRRLQLAVLLRRT